MSENKKGDQRGLEPYLYKCIHCGNSYSVSSEVLIQRFKEILAERDLLKQELADLKNNSCNKNHGG